MPKAIPKPVYPLALDSDYTLFASRNSSQSSLTKDVSESDDSIHISPQSANAAELWPDNGFITIKDELIYYDSVGRDVNGKVNEFKDCIRGVEGTPAAYREGTVISSNVIAQTHNQLVDVVIAIEDAIGDIGDMLKVGPQLKSQQRIRKNLSFTKPQTLLADVDMAFTSSLHQSITNILSCSAVSNEDCPDVEFDFNVNDQNIAEFCIRIFGNYNSFEVDFGDGITETNQLQGVHQYTSSGPFNPTVTVNGNNCCIVQSPTPPNEFCTDGPNVPTPSVPFYITIPELPEFPSFVQPKQICPGPLMNFPPIIFPEGNCAASTSVIPSFQCPSVIVSIVEISCGPSIISVISPCQPSITVLLEGFSIPSVITLAGCCIPSFISFDCISFCQLPSFDCISFCQPPSFDCISFCHPPSFDCISFCQPPSFDCVSFCHPPTFDCISFCHPPTFDCISFCHPPSFDCISFCTPPQFLPISFTTPPVISVDWGHPPIVSVQIICPASTTPTPPVAMAPFGFGPMAETQEQDTIPVTAADIGIPDEIRLIVPRIPEEIKILGPSQPIPTEITIKGDIPRSIEVKHNFPDKIFVDGSSIPRSILVEPAPNFPSVLRLEVTGMPQTLQVTGIPQSIKIEEDIPRTIQLLMPENPVVLMSYVGLPVELKPSPDLERLLTNLVVPPR